MTAEEKLAQSGIWTSGEFARRQIIRTMEEYAAQQVQEMKEELDKAAGLLDECRLQLECLDKRFPTGTTPNILAQVTTFLERVKQQP